MTPTAKARAIIGHEEKCRSGKGSAFLQDCICPPLPLAVRIATEEGTLREYHEPDEDQTCAHCGAYPLPLRHTGPCYPPLDDAKAWALHVRLTRAGFDTLVYERGLWTTSVSPDDLPPRGVFIAVSSPEEAVARLYLALVAAGLIPEEGA